MYQSFFAMTRRPFGATPQLAAYHPVPVQEEALETLRYCITEGRGIALLTGAPGTGKTLVSHRLAVGLEPTFRTAMVTNTNLSTPKALLQAVLYDLNQPYQGMEEQELRLLLTDHLLDRYSTGSRAVLIIDEAQNLAGPLLEEVRMLGNLEGENDKLLQIVLTGQPRLADNLRRPELESLSQRIAARATLGALDDEQTIAYIRHQLTYAGVMPERIFRHEAMEAVFEASGGIPRLINQVCERALRAAHQAESKCVDSACVERAAAELHGQSAVEPGQATGCTAPVRGSQVAPSRQRTGAVGREPWTTQVAPTVGDASNCHSDASCGMEMLSEGPAVPDEDVIFSDGDHPADEVFLEEELIVDQYARMDEARATSPLRGRSPDATGRIASVPAPAGLPDPARRPTTREPTKQTPGTLEGVELTGTSLFLEPTDDHASFEVGAGVTDEPVDDGEPDILIIEERPEQGVGNRARVDRPQAHGDTRTGPYRRLFTHARKS